MRHIRVKTIGTVILCVLSSCHLAPEPPPIRYGEVAVLDEADDRCSLVPALLAEIENTAAADIDSFRAAVYLYEPAAVDGEDPRSVVLEWRNDIPLSAGDRRAYCVDIAAAFHTTPEPPPMIDMLHINRVTFVDGKRWRDPLARFVWRRGDEGSDGRGGGS